MKNRKTLGEGILRIYVYLFHPLPIGSLRFLVVVNETTVDKIGVDQTAVDETGCYHSRCKKNGNKSPTENVHQLLDVQ